MALIGLLCAAEDARRQLTLSIEEMGHRVAASAQLPEALELLRGAPKPRMMVVADEPDGPLAASLLAEVERESPLLPVVAAMTRRDAARAVELMRAGAVEVIAPPWTRESLSACVSKALRFRGTSFEVVRPVESIRYSVFCFLAVALFLGAAFAYGTLSHRRRIVEEAKKPPPPSDWELPYSHPSGLTARGKELWIADWYAQALYRHDPAAMTITRSAAMPSEAPAAIAVAGDALYVVSQDGRIAKHMLDNSLKLLTRFPERFPYTVGMAYDGLYLWTLDGRSRILRKHLLDSALTVLAVYDYPGIKPAAIACDGKHLWSIDAGNRELLRHDLDEPRIVSYRLPLPAYQSGDWRPTGLAWDGVRFWSVAESARGPERGHIFQHPIPARVQAPPSS